MSNDVRQRFRELHDDGIFVMPNPWDVGTARLLASVGFPALATTSSGHAATLGRKDQEVTLDELVAHVVAIVEAVDVPLNVDAEYCFATETSEIAAAIAHIAEAGASGLSIEDFNPVTKTIDPLGVAIERVASAAEAAQHYGMVLTARAENHIYGVDDLDDTIARLIAYRDAGAAVVYPPGLVDLDDIARVVSEVGIAVNVLARGTGPSVEELASVGVRRVSTGGALARAAYGELLRAAIELYTDGTSTYMARAISYPDLTARLSSPRT
jgi:2-methylisocitrate lyase-like PEP mutase family enzyme